MPRRNKKTRIKGLPPKLQLQQKDATTGSYPSTVRIASDNRTGDYRVSYDDRNSIVFGERNLTTLADISGSILAYWKFDSPTVVSSTAGNYRTEYAPVAFPAAASQGATENDLTLYVSGNTAAGVARNRADLPWRGNALGRLDSSLMFNAAANTSDLWAVGSVINDTTLTFATGSPDKPFSISAWLQLTGSTYATIQYITRKIGLGGISPAEWSFSITSTGQLAFVLYDGSVTNNIGLISGDFDVPLQEWVHVVATNDGGGVTSSLNIYVNGEDVGQTPTAGGSYVEQQDTGSPVVVGSRDIETTIPFAFPGYIAELAFFDKALNPTEVRKVYDTRTSLTASAIDGIAYGIGLNPQSTFLQDSEQFTTIFMSGTIRKGVGDAQASFTPGQDLSPFRDNNNPAADGKSTGNPFYATGSAVKLVGEGFSQPLWSKTKVEIPIPVNRPATYSLVLSGAENVATNDPPLSERNVSYPMMYYNFDRNTWEGIGPGVAWPGGIDQDNTLDTFAYFGFSPSILMFSPASETATWSTTFTRTSGQFEWQASAGIPVTNFGFPYHPKFHATASQALRMSDFISSPFLVEKIVVQMSAAYQVFPEVHNSGTIIEGGTDYTGSFNSGTLPAAINNVFILNQRRVGGLTHREPTPERSAFFQLTASYPMFVSLSNGQPKQRVSTIRDLITYGGVTSFAANMPNFEVVGNNTDVGDPFPGTGTNQNPNLEQFSANPTELMTREVVFTSNQSTDNDLTALSWTGSFTMEIPAKHPVRFATQPGVMSSYFYTQSEFGSVTDESLQFAEGSRNGVGIKAPSGRDLRASINLLQGPAILAREGGLSNLYVDTNNTFLQNPYLLLPTDELIIGWQQPWPRAPMIYPDFEDSQNMVTGTLSEITFPIDAEARVILYGSQVSENKETHDTLNQLLLSNTVHEVIGDD